MYKIRVYIVPESLKSRSISHQALHQPYEDLNPYDLESLYASLGSRTLSSNALCDYTPEEEEDEDRDGLGDLTHSYFSSTNKVSWCEYYYF